MVAGADLDGGIDGVSSQASSRGGAAQTISRTKNAARTRPPRLHRPDPFWPLPSGAAQHDDQRHAAHAAEKLGDPRGWKTAATPEMQAR